MKIKDITQENVGILKAVVLDAISNAYKVAGYNIPSPKDLTEMVNLTTNDLTQHFRNNTTEEVTKVFNLGAHGEYGDYTGLSVRQFYQWMKTYNGMVVNVQPAEEDMQQAPQRESTPQDGRNLVNACYDSYRQNHYCLVPSSVLLGILEREGVFIPTDWERQDAEVRAEGNLQCKYLKKRPAYTTLGNYIGDNKDTEANSILLYDFFDKQIQLNKTKIFD